MKKKGTIASIIGVATVLGIALSFTPVNACLTVALKQALYGLDPFWPADFEVSHDGEEGTFEIVDNFQPSTCSYQAVFDEFRDMACCVAENNDAFLLKAVLDDPETDYYITDSDGDVYIEYPKALLEDWVDGGCGSLP